MRIHSVILTMAATFLLSACDLWPKELEGLQESISREVSGRTTVFLVGGDVVLIDVEGSPLYAGSEEALTAIATGLAEQAMAHSPSPLESVAVTFHAGEMSADPDSMRDFIFLVMDNIPVLQPDPDVDITGPLTELEIDAALGPMDESQGEEYWQCVREASLVLAEQAGDPETLDPAMVKMLSAETWPKLDPFSKRLFLAQAVTAEALFSCVRGQTAGPDSS